MNRLWIALACAAAIGCSKKNDAAESDKASASASAKAASASVSASVSASASAEIAAPLTVGGAYDAKVAAVRMPKDAPPFVQPESGATGAGEITLVLPAGAEGAVGGKASGALGEQVVTGNLEGGALNATVRPAASGDPAMTGTIEATVDGAGDARVVKGTLRASSGDGRMVREAAFIAKKK